MINLKKFEERLKVRGSSISPHPLIFRICQACLTCLAGWVDMVRNIISTQLPSPASIKSKLKTLKNYKNRRF